MLDKSKTNNTNQTTMFNATQKNLLTAAGLGVVAATPAAPLAALGLVAQPIVAATVFTKGRKLPARLAQGALGLALGFVGLGAGLTANPTYSGSVAAGSTAAQQVVEAPTAKPAPTVAAKPAPQAPRAGFTRANWNRVSSGMTKAQVEAILGDGKLLSSTQMMGSRTDLVQYGSYFSTYGSITYSDGRVFALSSNFG
tara:strand:+ start:966 stop:1556 length:591 start_codon:yes stop_codon:yes gene_type:complete